MVISNRNSQFISKFTKNLYQLLGTRMNPSTVYHPQTDGQTEQINQAVEQYLQLFINHQQDDWIEWLPLVKFSYNNKIQTSTGYSPFYLNCGQHPWKFTELRREAKTKAADVFVRRIQKIREKAMAALEKAALDMKKYYNEGRQDTLEHHIGDRMYLDGSYVSMD